jgi:hypothetical protein
MSLSNPSATRGVILLTGLLLAGCSGNSNDQSSSQAAALPEGHPPISGAAPTAAAPQGPAGVVLETMDGGGYTYARLQLPDREIWVAGPLTKLAQGDSVALTDVMGMGSFTSKALDRTFDDLYFTGAYMSPGAGAATATTDPSAAPPAAGQGTVVEAIPAAGYTYLRVSADGQERWLATNAMEVDEGATVSWGGGTLMHDFASKSLERTFDEILFVGTVKILSGSE